MPELTFAYKRRPFLMLFVVALGVACAAGFTYMALFEDNLELRFLGFYAAGWEAIALAWFFAVFMGGLALFGVYALFKSAGKPKSIVFGERAVVAPKAPISSKMIEIPYADIIKLSREDVFGQVMLHITHPGGKLSITKSWLADKDDFDRLQSELQSRWDHSTGVNVS